MTPRFPDPALGELRVRWRGGVCEFPVHHVRGGTSTGLVIWERLAPPERELREELLRHLMGLPLTGTNPGNRQITGLGRGAPTSNKVFFADVEGAAGRIVSTLAQLAADKSAVDWSVNCGNMSAALPVWALDTGLARRAGTGRFEIAIFNTNTDVTTAARMEFAGATAESATIPGVDGGFPRVDLFLHDPVGAKTGRLLPSGAARDVIDGVAVSCVDVAVPMVIVRAADLGKTAHEPIERLEADPAFRARLQQVWVGAGLRMGLKARDGGPTSASDLAESETIPKVCIVGEPRAGGHIAVRYFTPQSGHRSMAVSGACCLAAACLIAGSVAHEAARGLPEPTGALREIAVGIENPAGILEATIAARVNAGDLAVDKVAYRRSAQILLRGSVPLYRASPELLGALSDIGARRFDLAPGQQVIEQDRPEGGGADAAEHEAAELER
jgi:4-oxalomesaconate tautomerase